MIFILFNKSTSTKIYPIYNKRSLLFENKELNLIKLKPLIKFLICYCIFLLSSFASFFIRVNHLNSIG
jgi:hypothetical protein